MTIFATVPFNQFPSDSMIVMAQTVQWSRTYGTVGRDEAG